MPGLRFEPGPLWWAFTTSAGLWSYGITVEPFLMATSPQYPLLLYQRTVHTFTLILTSLQWPTLHNGQHSTTVMATKTHPSCQNNLSTTANSQQLMNGAYQIHFVRKGHETWVVQCISGLYFCMVWIFFIDINCFDCVTYLYAAMLHFPKNDRSHVIPLPPYNSHLSSMATFVCPQGDCCGEVQLGHCTKV